MPHDQLHNPKLLVARSYDRIAEKYRAWAERTRVAERDRYTRLLLEKLPLRADVLELGCGTGTTTARLAERCQVTAVDISKRCIAIAQQNVPSANFICADMAAIDYPASTFDAIVAFYSIIHLPRGEHTKLLHALGRWLRPGGFVMASMGTDADENGYEQDWLGAPMYWSSFDTATNCRMVEEAGLQIEFAREETADEDGRPVTFQWIGARKPAVECT